MRGLTAATLALLMIAALPGTAIAKAAKADVEVCFTPAQACQPKIIAAIAQARSRILVQAYSFTAAPIADALVKAHRRGVDVQVLLDRSQRDERYTSATFLANNGIPVAIDECCAIAHNKLIIIDDELVIGGSYNFSKAAETRNAENVTFSRSAALAAQYVRNWQIHRNRAEPYPGPGR